VQLCDSLTNPCTQRVLPDWAELPANPKFEKVITGAAGQKLFGATLGVFGFTGSMALCRLLAEQESMQQRFKAVADADVLRRYATRVDADFQAFTHEANLRAAEVAYAVLEPYQLPLLEGGTLDDVTSPSDKVAAGETDPILVGDVKDGDAIASSGNAPKPEAGQEQPTWLKGFLSSTCLAWGNQGSGKSWFVRLLALHKKHMGYKVIVFDPNSNRSEWMGVELYNTYDQIEAQMQLYVSEVMGRYEAFGKTDISEQQWRKNLWQQGKAIAVICEEMTTYADFVTDKELLGKFVKVAATLSRKQEMPVVFVAHNNTQTCLGDIKGLANLIARTQQIQLISTTDPNTSQPIASGKALIKMDGSDEWVEVVTPKLNKRIKDFRGDSEKVGDGRDYLERAWSLEFDVKGLSNPTQSEQPTPKLSAEAQKVIAWLSRKHQDGLEWLTAEQCRASGCVQGAKTIDIKAYFNQIVEAKIGVLSDRGEIRLT